MNDNLVSELNSADTGAQVQTAPSGAPRYPVVDGDAGSVDILGYATTRTGAQRVANRGMVDRCHVELYGPIRGEFVRVPLAWVAICERTA